MPPTLAPAPGDSRSAGAVDGVGGPAADAADDPPVASPEEVERAFLRHAPALFRYLYVRTRRMQDAEDLLADTFLHARVYGKPIANPGAWFYTVARRCANRFLFRRDREAVFDPVDPIDTARGRSGHAGGGAVDAGREHLDSSAPEIVALMALPEADRVILVVHGLEERPMAEVAALLGIQEATAWQRWQRARNRYFCHLVAVGVNPSDAWRRPRRAGRGAPATDAVDVLDGAADHPAAPDAPEIDEEGGRHGL